MDEFEIIRHLMWKNDISIDTLSKELGYKTHSGLSNRLNSKHMYVDSWKKILDALDCEIVVREKNGSKEEFPLVYDGLPSPLRFKDEGFDLNFDKILS